MWETGTLNPYITQGQFAKLQAIGTCIKCGRCSKQKINQLTNGKNAWVLTINYAKKLHWPQLYFYLPGDLWHDQFQLKNWVKEMYM